MPTIGKSVFSSLQREEFCSGLLSLPDEISTRIYWAYNRRWLTAVFCRHFTIRNHKISYSSPLSRCFTDSTVRCAYANSSGTITRVYPPLQPVVPPGEAEGEASPLWVDVQKLYNMCVLSLSWNFFVSHDKCIAGPSSKEPR